MARGKWEFYTRDHTGKHSDIWEYDPKTKTLTCLTHLFRDTFERVEECLVFFWRASYVIIEQQQAN